FIANLVDAIRDTRTVVVVNFRPEYSADWLALPHCRLITLAPLGPQATGELLADLLGRNPVLAPLTEKIGARAGGNPCFVEEVVRSLVETGVLDGRRGSYRMLREPKELTIPPTVHAVLAARIDRLAEREKAVLQTAAVIGKEFSLPVAARVSAIDEA